MNKKWYLSKIFWGAIVTIITGVSTIITGEATLEGAMVTILGAIIAIFRLFFTKTNLTT